MFAISMIWKASKIGVDDLVSLETMVVAI